MTHFIFVRHGQTDWNRDHRFRGRANIPLNEAGSRQVQLLSERLAKENIAAAYASPLNRTMATADILAKPHDLRVEERSELLDFDYGDWQGKLTTEVDPEQLRLWLTRPDRVIVPNGETVHALRVRVMSLVESLAKSHAEETILLVSHDMVGKILMCGLSGAESNSLHRFAVDNASLNRFDAANESYVIRCLNDTAHLNA